MKIATALALSCMVLLVTYAVGLGFGAKDSTIDDDFPGIDDMVVTTTEAPAATEPPSKTIWRQNGVANYLRKKIPAVSEMTACFYYEPIGAPNFRDGWLISIASPGATNGFLLGFHNDVFKLLKCQDNELNNLGKGADSRTPFTEAHRHCFKYTANTLEWFYDKTTPGVLEKHVTSTHDGSCIIKNDAYLVPVNDQDSVGGRLEFKQMFGGLLGDLQVWSHALTDQEIESLPCGAEGDLVKFQEMDIVGKDMFEAGDLDDCGVEEAKTIWRQDRIANYLRQKDIPAVSEMTACFYYEPIGAPNFGDGWLISIASPGATNGFLLGFHNDVFKLLKCQDDELNNLGKGADSRTPFTEAHRHCFKYTANTLEWFYDRTTTGVLEKHISAPHDGSCVIKDGASLVPLNDQDSVGGQLDSTQMFGGLLADLQVWNHALTDYEIKSLTCGAEGNLVKFKDMEIVGEDMFEAGDLDNCDRHEQVKDIWRQDSIGSYLRKTNLGAVSELTACFYYEPIGAPNFRDGWLISIASPGATNGFLLGFHNGVFKLLNCQDDENNNLGSGADSHTPFTEAHRHCFKYTSDTLKWFYDKTTPGVLELHLSSQHDGSCFVNGAASLVPLNDQDSVGGQLESKQMFGGLLGDLQVWNHALPDYEIESLGCGAVGNYVRFKEMEIVGEDMFIAGHPTCDIGRNEYQAWEQKSVGSYLRATNLPAMSELTTCFYFEPSSKLTFHEQWLLSIASPGATNGFLLGFRHEYLRLFKCQDETDGNNLGKGADALAAFTEAHRHCFVYDATTLKWYYDKTTPGVLELVTTSNHDGSCVIKDGASLVPLNDQDSVGGGLQVEQQAPGLIADLQVWDRALTDSEIARHLGCHAQGNVVKFEDFEVVGEDNFQPSNFKCTGN